MLFDFRHINSTFNAEYFQTFGAEMYEKSSIDPKKISFELWVIGGHERYRTTLTQFFAGISVILLCFDLTNNASFQELAFWYNEVKRNSPDAILFLVGTKADETESIVVKTQEITKLV
jgi:GTPase SAR1 family protein